MRTKKSHIYGFDHNEPQKHAKWTNPQRSDIKYQHQHQFKQKLE